jgi:hypothetical protein
VLTELGREYSAGVAAEVGARYTRALETYRADPEVFVTDLPPGEKQKWIDGLPNIAARWVEDSEARGIPAGKVLQIYMDAVRSRGGRPFRDWDREIQQQ